MASGSSRSRAQRLVAEAGGRRATWSDFARAAAFSWLCFAVMTCLAVLNEERPGRQIDDPILDAIPYVARIDAWNYWIWLLAWLGGIGALLRVDRRACARMLLSSGFASLARGVCVLTTGLGPVRGEDVNLRHPWDWNLRAHVVGQILDPLSVFFDDSAHIWLTKDLFFSGHACSTLLLVLYAGRRNGLRAAFLALHGIVVATVLLAHLHYTIDVVGGWAAASVIWWWRDGRRAA